MKKPNPDAIRREEEERARARYLARADDGACCVCGRPRDPDSSLLCPACIDESIERARVSLMQSVQLGDQRRSREREWTRVDAPA